MPVMNSNNSLLQLIQGQQLIHRPHSMAQTNTHQTTHQFVSSTTPPTSVMKQNKVPQQILPKPSNTGSIIQSTTTKTVVTQSKTAISQQFQTSQHSTPSSSPQHQVNTGNGQSGILLPGSNINAQPQLMLNQMPMLVQQNTPQGVQLILRPPTPQLAAPSLVLHNRPPQLQQPQPQQLLRILNTNGGMQLAATTPTFIVSSQVCLDLLLFRCFNNEKNLL